MNARLNKGTSHGRVRKFHCIALGAYLDCSPIDDSQYIGPPHTFFVVILLLILVVPGRGGEEQHDWGQTRPPTN